MTDPERVWAVEVGGLAEHEARAETMPPVPRRREPRRSNRPGDRRRQVRVFVWGRAVILTELLNGELRTGRFVPEPWPAIERIPAVSEA